MEGTRRTASSGTEVGAKAGTEVAHGPGAGPSTMGATDVTDYSQADSWCLIPEITKDVDTFFVYPTEYMASNADDPDYATLDNPEMRGGAQCDRLILASAFEGSTNLFMPYYRQASMRIEGEAWRETGTIVPAVAGVPYGDIRAALDYYFHTYNGGRPFIIASHSQGSAICTLALADYFKEHPDYLDRMVAAYLIGYAITKDYLDANPRLSFAAGECDTGVIVSWNTEGPENVETGAENFVLLPGGISINPLNWRLDDTYAPSSENLGSLIVDDETSELRVGDVGADARIDLDRGVVVTNADFEPIELSAYFGPASFHNGDYALFFNNIRDNVARRITAFRATR